MFYNLQEVTIKKWSLSSLPLNLGWVWRLAYNQYNAQKWCCVTSTAAFVFVTGTLMFGIISCHVRHPTILRPPGSEAAQDVLKRLCIGILADSVPEIPVDSHQKVPRGR